jgi:TP901 family phage tail tape measure protein
MVALAAAFVRLRPDPNAGEFRSAGTKMAGEFGNAYTRGADGKLRDSRGKFVTDSAVAGGKAGKGFGSRFSSAASASTSLGFASIARQATVSLAAIGVAGAVAKIAQIGMAYEDSLNIFKSVTRANTAQMGQVAAKARELGADIKLPGVSAAGAALAMTELAKSGLSVQQSMDAAKGTLQLARAATISEAEAAVITGNAINAFGLKARDTTFVVDSLAAAANSSSVEIGDVSLAFKMAAAVFSGFQGPAVGSKEAITELNTAIAILGNNGIKGSDAGTSLKQMLLQLTGPTMRAKIQMKALGAEAQGAKIPLDLMNDAMHGTASTQRSAIKEMERLNPQMKNMGDLAFDSQGKMRPLKEIIGLVTAATKDMTQEERAYAITQIFGSDAARAVIALMKGGLPVYDQQRAAVLRVGAAADVAAAKNAGLRGSIDNVRSQVENAAISIYNKVKGPLTAGLNGFAANLPAIFASIGAGFRTYALPPLARTATIIRTQVIPAIAAIAGVIAGAVGWLRQHDTTTRALAITLGVFVGAVVAYRVAVTTAAIVTRAWGVVMQAVKVAQVAWTAVSWLASAPVLAHTAAMRLSTSTIGTWIGVKRIEAAAWLSSTGATIKDTAAKVANRVAVVATTIATKAHAIATAAWAAITTGATAITGAFAVGFRALGAAMRANPIGAVITIITLLVGIIVVAYNKNETFRKIVQAVWAAVRIAISSTVNWFMQVAWPLVKKAIDFMVGYYRFLWNIVKAVWSGIVATIKFYWALIMAVFNIAKNWLTVTLPNNFRTLLNVARSVWGGIRAYIGAQVSLVVAVFNKLKTFITQTLPNAFTTGVNAIRNAWGKVQEAARKPVSFVVNSVINPLINGYNKIAGVFNAPKADTIKGFASGGRIPGAPSSTDNRMAQLVGSGGKALGALKVATGEFIVNARDTAKALPLLHWVNSGMKGGPEMAARFIGRRPTEMPGDGSEGWAFASGGLVGFVKDVWGAMSDPKKLIEGPAKAALARIPGSGPFKDMIAGLGQKLLSGLMSFVNSNSGGGTWNGKIAGGNVGKVQKFVQAQAGKPYVWASAGPRGYDCSGIVSAAYNLLKGRNPYSHTFSTGSLPGKWFRPGTGPLMAGWSHPGQAPAGASVGHMAGQIGGMPFESTGSKGVRVGSAARRISAFAHRGAAMASGGLVANPIVRLLDRGGAWHSGELGVNASGHTEQVLTGGPNGDLEELKDLLAAILVALQHLGVDVAVALQSNTNRAVVRSRTTGLTGGRRA